MSKRINVNPDHYKVGGRERPGKDVVADAERQRLEEARRRVDRERPRIPNQDRPRVAPGRRRRSESA